jgi:MFS family permease
MVANQGRGNIYYGWWVVVVCAIGLSTGPGQFIFGSLGLFIIPLGEEYGWGRGEISLALTFFTIALALCIPLAGNLVDRFGSRRVLLPSILVCGIGLVLIPVAATSLMSLYLVFALVGSLGAGANSLPYLRTISNWFDKRRGLAIGVAMGGSGFGYSYVPPMVQYLIDNEGWRYGYYLLAVITFFVAFPLAWLFLREAPTADDAQAGDELVSLQPLEADQEAQFKLSETLKSPLLWRLFFVFCLLSFSLYGVLAHLVPMMTDRGMSPANAALVQSTLGLSIVFSRIVIGYLIDRYFAPHVALACFALTAIGLAVLAGGATYAMAFVAAIFIGLSFGAEIDLLAYLTGRYFGVANFGKVYGILFTSFLLGTSLGPYAYGMVYETTGSYTWILATCVPIILIAAITTGLLPRYPDPGKKPTD